MHLTMKPLATIFLLLVLFTPMTLTSCNKRSLETDVAELLEQLDVPDVGPVLHIAYADHFDDLLSCADNEENIATVNANLSSKLAEHCGMDQQQIDNFIKAANSGDFDGLVTINY